MRNASCLVKTVQAATAVYFVSLAFIAITLKYNGKRSYNEDFSEDAKVNKAPVLNITTAPWLSAPSLPRVLSKDQHDLYIQLLEDLANLFYDANVTFLLCDGSLLGSYVMHDMLPWDDDVDVMVRYGDLPKVKRIFRNPKLWEKYHLKGYHGSGDEYDFGVLHDIPESADDGYYYKHDISPRSDGESPCNGYHKFKLYFKDTEKAGNRSWNWPFVDVKYYKENQSHVWNLDTKNRTRCLRRGEFYPLHLRPFSRLWLPAPKNTREVLLAQYHKFSCRRSKWSHRLETRQQSRKVRCWKLSSWYPFVWREDLPGGTLEVLKVDGRVVQYLGVPETYSIFQRPFAL